MVKESIKEVIDLKTEKEKEEERKNRIIASIGTFVTYTIILLLLLYFGFKAPDPPLDAVEGIAVVLGTTETGMNPTFEPVTPPQPQPKPEPVKPQEQEEIITEEASDVTIPAVKKKEEPKPKEKPVDKPKEPVKEPERKVNEDLLFKPGQNNSKGTGTEQGDQGKKDGKTDAKNWQGGANEGSGFGIEGMEGRGLKTPPRINDDTQREGKIVVSIVVDREGNVIEARGGVRGTTINDYNLITKAEEAARRTKFTPDPDAQDKQYGKITFNFKLE